MARAQALLQVLCSGAGDEALVSKDAVAGTSPVEGVGEGGRMSQTLLGYLSHAPSAPWTAKDPMTLRSVLFLIEFSTYSGQYGPCGKFLNKPLLSEVISSPLHCLSNTHTHNAHTCMYTHDRGTHTNTQ